MKQPDRILIVRTDRIGDVTLSTPVAANLKAAYPRAYIAFMCRPYTKEIVEGNPHIDAVIVYDKEGKHKSFLQTVKFALNLRKNKFDWAIILHPTNRSHLLTFLAGIPVRIGWDRKMAFLLTKKIPHRKQEGEKHELEYTLDILRELNIPVITKTPYFPIKDTAEKSVTELLEKKGIKPGEKFIVIHPSASCPSKRWPQTHFSRLIKLLGVATGLKVIIITAEKEKESAEQIIKENTVTDLRGKLTIAETGSLLKKTALFISNDSGPVHIAWSLNTPVISIFGRNNPGLSPERWKPLGKNSVYMHKDVGCPQCPAHNCLKGFLCLQAITPEEVITKACSLLQTE